MASSPGLADMPEEVLAMILREFLAGMVIKKINFTPRRVQNSHKFKRSWLPIMLANKTISHIARDIFSQEAIVLMKPQQLVTTKSRGRAAKQRVGENELRYFEQAAGDMRFVSYLLYYTSTNLKKHHGSGLRYTMFAKLKRLHLQRATLLLSNPYYFEQLRSLMRQCVRRGVYLEVDLDCYGSQGARMRILVNSDGEAKVISSKPTTKVASEQARTVIEEGLGCKLALSYKTHPGSADGRIPEKVSAVSEIRPPRWV